MNSDVSMPELAVDPYKDPVVIKTEDYGSVRDIQALSESLVKYRQEMGRLLQLIGNIRDEANKIELDIASRRRELANRYNLENYGTGQWALDFEKKEFVKTANGSPVIP